MKNRVVITLLTVIAVLLGANLLVTTSGTSWAQDRGGSALERGTQDRGARQPQRDAEKVETDRARGVQPERPTRGERPMPQREPRVVGITTAGDLVVVLWDNGAIESREVPSPR